MSRLVLGVTGHRVLAEMDQLSAGIDRALDAIERRFPGRPLVALTSLAEGADRLGAERTLARPGSTLRVVLPFALADYEQSFAAGEPRRQLVALLARAEQVVELPARGTREASYAAAGEYVVDHCEALLAVWDGEPAQGVGGTAANVERALRRGLPLCCVRAGNRRPGTLEPTTLGPEQGRLIMENL